MTRGHRLTTALPAALLLLGACIVVDSPSPSSTTTSTSSTTVPATTTTTLADCSGDLGAVPTELFGQDAPSLSLELSHLTYECAHEAVVTADSPSAIRAGATLGTADDVPVLVDGPGVADELDRLGVGSIRWVGPDPAGEFDVDTEVVSPAEVPAPTPPAPGRPSSVWVLGGDPDALPLIAAAATARGGSAVDISRITDLRTTTADTIELLRSAPAVAVGLTEDQRWQLATVQDAVELPGGGFTFDGKRLVAFYGNPTISALGVLGEQGPAETLARLAPLVDEYSADSLLGVPTFEMIATVASASAGADGDYSDEARIETLRPWIDFAGENGVYVILDLQPGRTDFLTQAQRYEEFLRLPHVGLALDPEWRLGPDQVHLRQIGSVDAAEINRVSEWLRGIVREERLPQKYFLVHQFKFSMITDRNAISTPPELFTVIQMDGQGPLPTKYETYSALTTGQDHVGWRWGWKNFYDEDSPMATPSEVLGVEPVVVFVSFQ